MKVKRPKWTVRGNLPVGGHFTGAMLNSLIRELRCNPRKIGEMGHCPQYVDEGGFYAIDEDGIRRIGTIGLE